MAGKRGDSMSITLNIVIGIFLLMRHTDAQKSDLDQIAFYTVGEPTKHQKDMSAAEREVRLEDFFWSGSGDGPPEFLKKVHTAAKDGREVIIKTETLIATVYAEGQTDDDQLCLDCIKNGNGLASNYTTDRRYWLLTVVAGFLRPNDMPLLEGNLAKLYRIAFTRQQSHHLGISHNLVDRSNNTARSKRETEEYSIKGKRGIQSIMDDSEDIPPPPYNSELDEENDEETKGRLFNGRPYDDHIRIVIHNVTAITDEDIQNWDTSYDDANDQRSTRPLANQTEIIYSVFVNGKPVLATAAAEDMKLVSESEVASIIKKDIYMKAEPYLKEPQATPLVPAGKNGNSIAYSIFNNHPLLITVASITILLLILLLVALLLMTRAKRIRSAEVKRLSSRQGLLTARSDVDDLVTVRTATDGALSRTENDNGIENVGFVYDHPVKSKTESGKRQYPSIDFPLPPVLHADTSSTTSTSDSSVYCPVNKPDLDLQTMLDEKANKLFDKRRKTTSNEVHGRTEHTYSTTVKKRDKRAKAKMKRKYLAENRVGSIEEKAQVHSSQASFSTDSISDSLKPDFDHFEHNEVFNPNTNYHRNKLIGDRRFIDKIYDSVDNTRTSPIQAINRDLIKALEPGERTSESGSIGSFLSMASVKSFPRQPMPEPLHRVLEPVSVTHYDYFDNTQPSGTVKKPSKQKSVTLVDYSRHSQSDGPDPGVIGPIVWEIHKKRLTNQHESIESPIRDPASTRDRFEGLLEGAIQMYTEDSSPTKSLKTLKKEQGHGNSHRRKDNRGKSAIVSGFARLSRSNSENRPVTAGPTKSHSNTSTQPPTPNGRAWGSGAPSPLVRPLSAGPFHCPDPPTVDVARVLAHQSTDRTQLSAAPLIEAIQNELKKFKRENTK